MIFSKNIEQGNCASSRRDLNSQQEILNLGSQRDSSRGHYFPTADEI
jgi:hypothetical protein